MAIATASTGHASLSEQHLVPLIRGLGSDVKDINFSISLASRQISAAAGLSSSDGDDDADAGTILLENEDERWRCFFAILSALKQAQERLKYLELLSNDYRPSAVVQAQLAKTSDSIIIIRHRYKQLQTDTYQAKVAFDNRQRKIIYGIASDEANRALPPAMGGSKSMSLQERAITKAQDATAALRRTHQLLTAEVAKSGFNLESLEASTNMLLGVSDRYNGFELLLDTSHQFIRHLERADSGDKRNMLLSLGLLAASVSWVIYRHILKTPLYLSFLLIAKILSPIFTLVFPSPQQQVSSSPRTILATTPSSTIASIITSSYNASTSLNSTIISSLTRDEL